MVEVVVRRFRRDGTGFDPDFKVPNGQMVYGLQETVRALVRWEANERVDTATGDAWVRRGSFAVAVDKDPGFSAGDKVERIGGVEISPPVYITSSRPSANVGGHYKFVRYDFASRQQGV